jgi:hypothetical protein
MKFQGVTIALTGINLVLLLGLLAQAWPATADTPPGMLRGSGLQIVDSAGNVRASISILPASTMPSGEVYPETVLLRLIDANGQPSTKISTSTDGAGLSFVGGDDQSYVILGAKGAETTLKMVEPDGREQLLTP